MIKILIVDDHGILRAGLRALLRLEKDMEVVGDAHNADQATKLIIDNKPDVVLMDISMPDMGGIELTKLLTQRYPNLRILILTIHDDETLMRTAIQNGASGYILKRALESELVNAIHSVAAGDMYIHPSMTRSLFDHKTMSEYKGESITLTSREIDVLKLIVQGYTNRKIAERLSLSVRTIESHRANIMDKLDLRSRVELVRYAAAHGLLDFPN